MMDDGGRSVRDEAGGCEAYAREANGAYLRKAKPSEDECCAVSGIESGQTGNAPVRLRRSIWRWDKKVIRSR